MKIKKRPTMNDVAKLANVSQTTVSRVLNGKYKGDPLLATKIQNVANQLGYTIEKQNNSTTLQANRSIGILIPDITNPIFSQMVRGIDSIASKYGYNLLIADSFNNSETEFNRLKHLLNQPIKGLIWIANTDPSRASPMLQNLDVPVVLLDRFIPNTKSYFVGSLNKEGALQAARYILSLGHREILLISGPKELQTTSSRIAGFKKASKEFGLTFDHSKILYGDFSIDSGYRLTKKHILANGLPTCIFALNDLMAYGVLSALKSLDINVPEQVSVVGYDDVPYSDLLGLTTVTQPAFEMGSQAFTIIYDILEHEVFPPSEHYLLPRLTIRTSCKKL